MNTGHSDVQKNVLIIGGGIAGLDTALQLSTKGFFVYLVEREPKLGGILRHISFMPDITISPNEFIEAKINAVLNDPNIEVILETKITTAEGMVGDFCISLINTQGEVNSVHVGSIVLATGFQVIFCPVKFNLGISENVIGNFKLEKLLLQKNNFSGKSFSFVLGKANGNNALSYKIALKNAIYVRENFKSPVNVFYNNVKISNRTLDNLYNKAKKLGIKFYKFKDALEIEPPSMIDNNNKVMITYEDYILRQKFFGSSIISCDFIVLPDEILPSEASDVLAQLFNIATSASGFFRAENEGSRAFCTSRDGIFSIGGCQSLSLVCDITHHARQVAEHICKNIWSNHHITS